MITIANHFQLGAAGKFGSPALLRKFSSDVFSHLFYCRDLTEEEFEGILKAHQDSSVTGQIRRIVVQRRNVWRSASNFWKLPTVGCRSGLILCKFSGELDRAEPSADQGGPRREFFELLLPFIVRDSGLFSSGVLSIVVLI